MMAPQTKRRGTDANSPTPTDLGDELQWRWINGEIDFVGKLEERGARVWQFKATGTVAVQANRYPCGVEYHKADSQVGAAILAAAKA